MRILFLFAALTLLAACASLNEDQCRAGNWYDIGLRDGSNGRSLDFILQHAKACNEFGIAPKASPWRKGREAGLKSYCTPFNAYDIGRNGRHLNPVCTSNQAELERANDRGRSWYRIEQDIRKTEREIAQINDELANRPTDDPVRTRLISQRSHLRLDLTLLRARQHRYRY